MENNYRFLFVALSILTSMSWREWPSTKNHTQRIQRLSGIFLETKLIILREFWEILHEFNEEQKKKFLMFLTGSDRAPVKGLSDMMFVISKHGDDSDRYNSEVFS